MFTCNDCQLRANGRCSQLSNVICGDFRIIPHQDPAVVKAAADHHDMTKGRGTHGKFISREEKFKFANANPKPERPKIRAHEDAVRVYDQLVKWRLKKSRESGTMPYYIFKNYELMEIASHIVYEKGELLSIKYIGDTKFALYGDELYGYLKSRD